MSLLTRLIAILACLTFPATILAGEHKGTHGMLLLLGDGHLIGSHFPLWRKPHDFQAFVEVSFIDAKTQKSVVKKMEKSNNYFTLVPKPFDADKLKSGTDFNIKVDVYDGHFERAGKKIVDSANASMRALFYRQLVPELDEKNKSKYEKYYALYSGRKTFLFNRISAYRPFDHVVEAESNRENIYFPLEVKLVTSKSQPSYSGSLANLKAISKRYDLDIIRTIYLEKDELKW
ncbi:hypothetical protein [Aliikangiella coralliicola]|uniref:DUF3108 domain-containing protein n=1 Tax=Aliikangiella coralliicola TaxID=2592383 RepID=A0A545UBV3_9GAMM|nr:hypothetical protein [Aliikangiella coralliicola]TQV86937.1 hypothetical protein FLL46_14075 [Aliikangiella coralliicola]